MYRKRYQPYKSPNIVLTPTHYDVPPSKRIRLNDHTTNCATKQIESSLIVREDTDKHYDTVKGNGNLIQTIIPDTAQTNSKPLQNLESNLSTMENFKMENYSNPTYSIKPKQTTLNYDKHLCDDHSSIYQSTHNTKKETVTDFSPTIDKNNGESPIVSSVFMKVEKSSENKINKTIKHVLEIPKSQNEQNKSNEIRRNTIGAQKPTNKNKQHVKNQKGINNPKSSLLKKQKRSYKKLKLVIDVIYMAENDKNIEDGSTGNEDCSFLDDINVDEIVESLEGCQMKHTISNIIETNVNIEKTKNATKEFANICREILSTDYIENMLNSDSTKFNENIDCVKCEKVELSEDQKNSINCDTKNVEKSFKSKIKLLNHIDTPISKSNDIKFELINNVAAEFKKGLNMPDEELNVLTNNGENAENVNNSANVTFELNIEQINHENISNNILVSTSSLIEEQALEIKDNNSNINIQERGTNNKDNIQIAMNIKDCTFDKNIEEIILNQNINCNNEIINIVSNNVKNTEKVDNIDFTLDINIEQIINQSNNDSIERKINNIQNGENTINIDNVQDFTRNKNAEQTVNDQNNDGNIECKNVIRNGENTEDVDNIVDRNIDTNLEQAHKKQYNNNFESTTIITKNEDNVKLNYNYKQTESQVPVKETEDQTQPDYFKNVDQNTQNELIATLEKESNETSLSSFQTHKSENKQGVKVEKKSKHNTIANGIKLSLKGSTFNAKDKFQSSVNYLNLKDQNLVEITETKLSKIFNGDIVFDHLIQKRFTSTIMCFKNLDSNGITPGYYTVKMLCNKKVRETYGLNKAKLLYELQYSTPRENYSCIRLYEHFNVFGHYCFVMEHYPMNFKEYMDQYKKSLHINNVKKLAIELANAVSILRNKGIVHTDIKPTHILVNITCEKLKLCGFDHANYISQLELCPYMGTINYRPPEVILGHSVGPPMDVWATALVLYEMATNKQLFPGHYNNDILFKHMCTLGNIPWEVMCNSQYTNDYFSGTIFMRKVGLQRIIEVKSFIKSERIFKTIHEAYNRDWSGLRNWAEKNRDYNDLRSFHMLLEQMLRLNPNARLPIEFVKVNSFMI